MTLFGCTLKREKAFLHAGRSVLPLGQLRIVHLVDSIEFRTKALKGVRLSGVGGCLPDIRTSLAMIGRCCFLEVCQRLQQVHQKTMLGAGLLAIPRTLAAKGAKGGEEWRCWSQAQLHCQLVHTTHLRYQPGLAVKDGKTVVEAVGPHKVRRQCLAEIHVQACRLVRGWNVLAVARRAGAKSRDEPGSQLRLEVAKHPGLLKRGAQPLWQVCGRRNHGHAAVPATRPAAMADLFTASRLSLCRARGGAATVKKYASRYRRRNEA